MLPWIIFVVSEKNDFSDQKSDASFPLLTLLVAQVGLKSYIVFLFKHKSYPPSLLLPACGLPPNNFPNLKLFLGLTAPL